MNRENRRAGWNKKLPPCPLCGLDSGERVEDAAQVLVNGFELLSDYCPNCGAKMDGGDNTER